MVVQLFMADVPLQMYHSLTPNWLSGIQNYVRFYVFFLKKLEKRDFLLFSSCRTRLLAQWRRQTYQSTGNVARLQNAFSCLCRLGLIG